MSPATVGSGTAAGPDGQAGPAEAPPATTNRHGGQASDHPVPAGAVGPSTVFRT
jgi:hypothetical protein